MVSNYIFFTIVAFFSSLIILVNILTSKQVVHEKIFIRLIEFSLIHNVIDTFWGLTFTDVLNLGTIGLFVSTSLYYCSNVILSYYFFIFILKMIYYKKNVTRYFFILAIPALIFISAVVVNFFVIIFFNLPININSYLEGNWFLAERFEVILYTVSIAILTVVKIFNEKDDDEKKKYHILFILTLAPICFELLQIFFITIPCTSIAYQILIIINYTFFWVEKSKNTILNLSEYHRVQLKNSLSATALFHIEFNVTKNLIVETPIQQSNDNEINLLELCNLQRNSSYTDFIKEYKKNIYQGHIEDYEKYTNLDYITECFENGINELTCDYSVLGVNNQTFNVRDKLFLTKDAVTKDIIGFSYIIDRSTRQRASSVFTILSTDYKGIYRVDIPSGNFFSIRTAPYVEKKYRNFIAGNQNYSEFLNSYIKQNVYKDDVEKIFPYTKMDYLTKVLQENEIIYEDIRTFRNTRFHFSRMKILRLCNNEGELTGALFAFEDKDKEEIQNNNKLLLTNALLSSAVINYNINLTKDIIESDVIQQLHGEKIDVLYTLNLAQNCKFTQFIDKRKDFVDERYKELYIEFFKIENLIKRYKADEKEISIEYKIKDPFYKPICVKQKVFLYTDFVSGDIHAFTYATDITAQMQYNEMQKKALNAAQEASNAKSAFLFNMSHDIRTPMNAIMGFTKMIKKYNGNQQKVLDCVEKLESTSLYLETLINNVLDMAQIESGKIEINPEPVHIPTLLKEIKDLFWLDMNKKNLDFNILSNIDDETILVDKLRITQILLNLIGNAQKYTPNGGKICFLLEQLRCEKSGFAKYKGIIQDTGIGISKEFQEKLFESFERERTSSDSGIQGTGLGLAITKKLFDLMNGSIECKSEIGVGTTFTFEITCQKSSKDLIKQILSFEQQEINFEEKRLLIVEDNSLNREIILELLSDYNFMTETATNGQEAVEIVEKSKENYFDAILMDIQMPIMDGYEATRIIRSLENKTKANIPIIAITANAFEEDREKSKERGINTHVAKPINIDVLINELSILLR